VNAKELSNALAAAVKAKAARARHAIEKIEALVREYDTIIASATERKARMELVVTPQMMAATKGGPPARLLLRGVILLVVGDMRINVCDLGVLEQVAHRPEEVRAHLEDALVKDEIVHNLLALEMTDYYGHRLKDEQTAMQKKLNEMLKHQVDEFNRSEGWRDGREKDDE